jgi:hypothetical protein
MLADLGFGVLDGALVETCACVLIRPSDPQLRGTFVDLRQIADSSKASRLLESLHYPDQQIHVHTVRSAEFNRLPGRQIAYWVSSNTFSAFSRLPSLEPEYATVVPGLTTLDNDRFLRNWWEVEPVGKWVPYAKGGDFSTFFYDNNLVLDWNPDGQHLKAFIIATHGGSPSRFIANSSFYFRAGLTYPRKTVKGFNLRALPAGHIFDAMGISIFPSSPKALLPLLGLLNSSFANYCLIAQTASRQWEKGMVAAVPIEKSLLTSDSFSQLAAELITLGQRTAEMVETSHLFFPKRTTISQQRATQADINDRHASLQAKLDLAVLRAYGLEPGDILLDNRSVRGGKTSEDNSRNLESDVSFGSAFVSMLLGCVFGRWDIRFATGEKPAPGLPDPFERLPVCPPGQLQDGRGLPLTENGFRRLQAQGQWNYPLELPWDGILVDDPGHPLDVEAPICQVFEIIWKDQWELVEREATDVLGVRNLRDYFRKPAGFFADHLKSYSKSRRQAPIYWPLSTKSGSYTIWLYYHRLTDQTLFLAVNEFVKPKISQVEAELSRVSANDMAKSANRAVFEGLNEFRSELIEFQNELLRVAQLPYKPNLNDGVLITASPLWKLFRLSKWSKDLKACWDALSAGKYDWAHLAYTIWPERVKKICETDRSIAIAHDLEHLCKTPTRNSAKRRKKAASEEPPEEE